MLVTFLGTLVLPQGQHTSAAISTQKSRILTQAGLRERDIRILGVIKKLPLMEFVILYIFEREASWDPQCEMCLPSVAGL